jgi:dihydrodipicolinate synthase/N-acetylneuraminate lyase
MSWEYRGILPAMQLPFEQDLGIDEVELRRFTKWLAGHRGIGGLVTNGHTGEVFALSAKQRAQATRIVADEVGGKLPVVSGICCEGIGEAVEQAQMAHRAGAVVYGTGEPTGDAHARMKMAMYLAGLFKSPTVQPPTQLPTGAELQAIKDALRNAGMMQREAA